MIISYRCTDGDSIQGIAMRILGDANRWSEIAKFNRLHAPYISNDILDYYGSPSAKGTVVSEFYEQDDFTHHFFLSPIPDESVIDTSGTFIVGNYDLNGKLSYEILKINTYNKNTGELITLNHPEASSQQQRLWFSYPSEIPTKTARTGDLLYIQDGTKNAVRASQKFYDPLGTDILLDDRGKMQWTNQTVATGYLRITGMNVSIPLNLPIGTYFAHNASGQIYQSSQVVTFTPSQPIAIIPVSSVDIGALGSAGKGSPFTLIGTSTTENIVSALKNATILADTLLEAPYRPADISTVNGAENVRQALVNRLGTRRGELVYHPNYGNMAFEEIGVPDSETEQGLIEAYSISCMQKESRISEILSGRSRRDSDSVYVSANVRVRATGQKIRIDDIELRLIDSDISQTISR